MARFTIEVNGLRGVGELFDDVEKAADPQAAVNEVGAILLNRIRTRFLNETDPDGAKWPKSQAALNRARSGRGGGTLFDTGALWNSIQLFNRGDGEVAIATDIPYAPKLQEGRDGLPARVFLGFSDEDVDVASRLISNRIARNLR